MYRAAVIVALAGPPWYVRMLGSSKSCIVPLVEVTAEKRMMGTSRGTVMVKNCRALVAPSTSAASKISRVDALQPHEEEDHVVARPSPGDRQDDGHLGPE